MCKNRSSLLLAVLGLWCAWCFSSFGVTSTYDSLHRLTRVDYDNGASIAYTYDAAGNRLAMISQAAAESSGILAAWDFYGIPGNVTTFEVPASVFSGTTAPVLIRSGYYTSTLTNAFLAWNFPTNRILAEAEAANKYFLFSISNTTPVMVTNVSMCIRRSGSLSPTGFTLRVSSSPEFSPGTYTDSCFQTGLFTYNNLTASNLNISGEAVYFRLYGYAANGTTAAGFAGTTNSGASPANSGVDGTLYDLIVYGYPGSLSVASGNTSFRNSSDGSFAPASRIYTVSNESPMSLDWTVTHSQSWISMTASNGTLQKEESSDITVSVNAAANELPAGIYTDTLVFSNSLDSLVQSRSIELKIVKPTNVIIQGSTRLTANSSNACICRIQYSDGTVSNVTGQAVWSIVGDTHGAVLNGSAISVGNVTTDATVTVQAVYGGFTNTQSILIKDIPPGLSSLESLFDVPKDGAMAVIYSNGYAYVACGYAGLIIFDVTDSRNPVRVGGYDTDGFARALAVQSNKVFIADDRFGLQIVDVTDPTNPMLTGKYATSGSCYDIAVSGSYAYLAAYSSGMLVFNINNPASPQLIKSYNAGTTRAYGIAVDGNYAYVADYTNGLKIIDVSTPANPVLSGSYAVTGQARDVAVQGGYAYVAAYTNGLQIINVGNPSAPVYAGGYVTQYSYGVAVDGSFAYLANGSYGFQIFDISNPSVPVSVYTNSSYAEGIFVADGRAYLSPVYYDAMHIWDVSVPANPACLHVAARRQNFYDVVVKGSYAYLAAYWDGLITVDISNPDNPVIVTTNAWDTSSYAHALDIVDDTLYVGAGSDGLVIYDLSSPAAPELISVCDFTSYNGIWSVKVSGGYAFCGNQYYNSTNSLGIVDVRDPFNPVYVGGYNTGDSAYGVDVQGSFVYLASDSKGMQIFDVSDPETPVLRGGYARASSPMAGKVSVDGGYAYVLDNNDVLQIVDIQDPDNPTLRQKLDLGYLWANDSDIHAEYPYVYIAWADGNYPTNNGLWVIDVSDMDRLIVTNYPTSGYGRGIAVSGGYVYLADDPKALHIFTFGEKEPTGISIDGSSRLIAYSTNTYTCHVQYTDGSSSNVTDSASWSLIGSGATLKGNVLSIGDIVSDSTVTVQAVCGGVTNTLPVTLKFIPPGLTPLGTLFNDPTAKTEEVIYSNGYAYVVCGYAGLVIFDVSDPANPFRVGGYDTDGESVGIAMRSNTIYIADGYGDFKIVDVSTPSAPMLVGSWQSDYDVAYTKDITLSGRYAYLAARTRGLLVIDINDVSNPQLVGELPTDFAMSVAVDGSYAYVADFTNGLKVIDISTPSDPVLVSSYTDLIQASVVVKPDDYLYVADYTNGLQIIDVSDPLNPAHVGGYVTKYGYDVFVAGSYAYLANSGYGVEIVDISNPSSPVPVGVFDDNLGSANRVFVVGGTAYVANDYGGLQILDVSVPASPSLLGSYDTHRYAYDVAVKGSYAYLAAYRDGLIIVDISNPAAPIIVATNKWTTYPYAYRLDISGDYLYVAANSDGLVVYDLSNPASPAFVTKYDFVSSGYIRDIKVSGNYAFCVNSYSSSTNTLGIVNVSNPANPVYVGGYNTGGSAYGIDVQGQYAYLASYTNGLQIFDISNPTNPALAGSYVRSPFDEYDSQTPNSWQVDVSGSYAYLADAGQTLEIIDISNPQAPIRSGSCHLGWSGSIDLFSEYPYVYIAYPASGRPEKTGLWIVDVNNPANPVVTADYPSSGYSHGVAVDNGHVYLADDPRGLHTFTWGAVPTPVKSITNFVVSKIPGGISWVETLSTGTTNSYEGLVEFSDKSIHYVTTSATWSVVGDAHGAVFDEHRLTADNITSNGAVITVQGSYGGASGTLDVTLYYDRNNNGLPDWWEIQCFGSSAGINPDGICSNGINTVLEAYIAGLDPNDSNAAFLTSILPGRILQWDAVSGRVYSVYWTTNLLSGFQCLESNIPWTQGSFTNPTIVPCGYYKIDVRLE